MREGVTMNVSTIGLDLAKKVFQVYGVDTHGRVVVRKVLKRAELAEFFANLPPCLIGREACGTAHYWGRKLESFGHTVRLMAPRLVKPYLTGRRTMRRLSAKPWAAPRCGLRR